MKGSQPLAPFPVATERRAAEYAASEGTALWSSAVSDTAKK